MMQPKDSVLDFFDLSGDSLTAFPDLSLYNIKSLNLSHNKIDTLIKDYLPKGIEKINLSHNLFTGIFKFRIDDKWQLTSEERKGFYKKSTIREIDLSYNKLTGIDIGFPLRKIIISHNNITYINFNHLNMNYIDISNNPNLSNVVQFQPEKIDTVIRNNIANNKPLVPSNNIIPHNDFVIADSIN